MDLPAVLPYKCALKKKAAHRLVIAKYCNSV